MGAQYDKLIEVVCRHVSEIHTRSIVDRAFRSADVDGREPHERELPRIVARIERSLRLYLGEEPFEHLHRDLLELLPAENQQLESEIIDVKDEGDIVMARSRARELALVLGADRVPLQKAATVVSELARNIVSYTDGGYIELSPGYSPSRLRIRAVDRGRGIPGIEKILSGHYKSRTGLGLGLLGTKRLADEFHIETSGHGTRVEALIVF